LPFSRIFKEFGVSTGRDKRPVAELRRKMRIGKTEKFAVICGLFSNTRTVSYNNREEQPLDAAE
ncbi:MAG TPA: hypothetical protein O0X19_06620, partial [Methanocorpusculum sp.]|nr:hypothetical protein [Methanocorpusculum sp.]